MVEWGPEIEHTGGGRPSWLRVDDHVRVTGEIFVAESNRLDWGIPGPFRLPADHPYYRATEAGFTYWPGGDVAPTDWDGGDVLQRDGTVVPPEWYFAPAGNTWRDDSVAGDIIGYRKRAADMPGEIDTVTIARMTEAEARARFDGFDCVQTLKRLNLIRDETPVERFKHENPHWELMPRDALLVAALTPASR